MVAVGRHWADSVHELWAEIDRDVRAYLDLSDSDKRQRSLVHVTVRPV